MAPIDVHSHLFNLRYLPVAGIIRRYSNHRVGVRICKGLQWFLWKYTASNFGTDRKEDHEIQALLTQAGFTSKELSRMSEDELTDKLSKIPTPEDLQGTPLAEALDEFEETEPTGFAPGLKFSTRTKLTPLTAEEYEIGKGRLKRLWNWLISKLEDGADHVRWFAMMMNSEEFLFKQLCIDNNGVEDYVHHLVDVDHFFDDLKTGEEYSSYYPFYPTQVERMQQLHKNHAGHLVGFVCFNPRKPDTMKIITDSLAMGFSGVKFYPPMGYKPNGDDDAAVAKQIGVLIDFCVMEDVALFTHCNNSGFQAKPREHSGYCSNPVYWEEVLLKQSKLRLCLGHGGGGEGWFTENKADDHILAKDILGSDIKDCTNEQLTWNQSYAAMVFKLCVQYENVYCDFSYLDDMINRDGTLNNQKRLNFRTRLLKLLKSEPKFADKIMYGSDWHMLYREKKHSVYYKIYKEFFADAEFDEYRERFFAGNVLNYTGKVMVY